MSDKIFSRPATPEYRKGWDRIFGGEQDDELYPLTAICTKAFRDRILELERGKCSDMSIVDVFNQWKETKDNLRKKCERKSINKMYKDKQHAINNRDKR